jgi:hypothetical protein
MASGCQRGNREREMTAPEEYLTIQEVAKRLNWSPKTLRNKMAAGVFKKGVHYDSPPGLPTLFRWGAVMALYKFHDEGKPDVHGSNDQAVTRSAYGARVPR